MGQRSYNQSALYAPDVPPDERRTAFLEGRVPVTVYGLGKMGLPLATVFAAVSGSVTGADVDPDVVAAVNDGECPVAGEPGLPEAVATSVANGELTATSDTRAAADRARLHVVIVPTVLDDANDPDLSALEAVVEDVANGLESGDMVVVESTVPPGTCAGAVEPELAAQSGLDPAEFGVAFCPERTASGRALRDIRGAYPKVVGGVDRESTRVARLVYDELTDNDVIEVADATTAECVKVFEGFYRDVNIALANELARLTDELGVDVREAIDVANTQPFCDIHDPGPGVGGHCIPYYPYFVINSCETEMPLLRTAREVNEGMPAYTVETVERQLEHAGIALEAARVVLLGVTYRPGVDETSASPAFPVAEELTDRGAEVYAVDPVCSDHSGLAGSAITMDVIPAVDPDAVVLLTAHPEFEAVSWDALEDVVVVDGRDALGDLPHPTYVLGSGPGAAHSVEVTDGPVRRAVSGRPETGSGTETSNQERHNPGGGS
ncbi:nucleotide sugar dehydrogenase [Halobacteriales archaeon Cl-PHB]